MMQKQKKVGLRGEDARSKCDDSDSLSRGA